jgi:hypothetical protein
LGLSDALQVVYLDGLDDFGGFQGEGFRGPGFGFERCEAPTANEKASQLDPCLFVQSACHGVRYPIASRPFLFQAAYPQEK